MRLDYPMQLVGKAAQRDMLSMCAAFIGILAGLGLTLMCLALYRYVRLFQEEGQGCV